jgi:hypothetical protein
LRFKIEFASGKSLRNKFPETSAKLNIPNRFVLFLTAVTMATGKERIFEHIGQLSCSFCVGKCVLNA